MTGISNRVKPSGYYGFALLPRDKILCFNSLRAGMPSPGQVMTMEEHENVRHFSGQISQNKL